MTEEGPLIKRMKMTRDDLGHVNKDELKDKISSEVDGCNQNTQTPAEGVEEVKEGQDRLRQQNEAGRRENLLIMRLAAKEQEMQDYMNQIQELKQSENLSTAQLRSMLLDPAINLMFQRMRKEVETSKQKLEQAQNDLTAWKFTPDSQTGKRLMAKCRMLLQENEDLGKSISSGRTAKLEGEIALQKTLVQEMKKNQTEMDELMVELDDDMEGMQSTIYLLQQQLKDSREQVTQLQDENRHLRQECTKTPVVGGPVVSDSQIHPEQASHSPSPPSFHKQQRLTPDQQQTDHIHTTTTFDSSRTDGPCGPADPVDESSSSSPNDATVVIATPRVTTTTNGSHTADSADTHSRTKSGKRASPCCSSSSSSDDEAAVDLGSGKIVSDRTSLPLDKGRLACTADTTVTVQNGLYNSQTEDSSAVVDTIARDEDV